MKGKILEAIIQLFVVIPDQFCFNLICPPELDFWYIKLVNSKVNDISNFALTLLLYIRGAAQNCTPIIVRSREFALTSWDLTLTTLSYVLHKQPSLMAIVRKYQNLSIHGYTCNCPVCMQLCQNTGKGGVQGVLMDIIKDDF